MMLPHLVIVVTFLKCVHLQELETIDDTIEKVYMESPFSDDALLPGVTLVELDMLLTRQQLRDLKSRIRLPSRTRVKRKAVSDLSRRWTNRTVAFVIADFDFNSAEVARIRQAMQIWERSTCIRFREVSRSFLPRNFVRFQNGMGCSSMIGMSAQGSQPINLRQGCRVTGIIAHELGHALGLVHEHSRPDRDSYVRVFPENADPQQRHNFRKYNREAINYYGVAYDYTSLMHYGPTAFSVNGQVTIATLDPRYQNIIGRAMLPSTRDIEIVNQMYGCGTGGGQFQSGGGSPFPSGDALVSANTEQRHLPDRDVNRLRNQIVTFRDVHSAVEIGTDRCGHG